jgi:acyl carrier protein
MTTQSEKTLFEQVIKLIGKQVDVPEKQITLDSDFQTDLGFDSLGLVEFIMDVEEQFSIDVPDETASEIRTVRQAIDEIERAIERQRVRQPA